MNARLLAVCLCAAACGGGVVTNKQDNSTPQGVVEGRILDGATGQPLGGVQVSSFVDMPVTATTDGTGRYKLGPLPAGSYTLLAEAPGFVKRIFPNVSVAGAAGNYPTGNVVVTRDFDMAKADAAIDGNVVTSTTAAAKGVTVYVDLRTSGYDLVAAAVTDMTGKFKFSGLPGSAAGTSVTVSVAPYDENMDGQPDYNTNTRSYTLYPGATATGAIAITALTVPVISSNIADSDLAPMEAITMTFGSAIRATQSTFTLQRSLPVGLNVMWDAAGTTVTITPAGGPLAVGANYNFSWNVRATNGSQANGSQSFVVRPTNVTPPGNVTNFRITTPSGMQYDYNSSSIGLAWDAVNDSGGYVVYVKDLQANPAYLRVTNFSASATTGTASLSTTYFGSSCGVLCNSNHITLALVATDAAGNEGALGSAPTLEISDNVPPRCTSGSLSQSLNNTGTTTRMVQFSVSFSEPMQASTNPTIALPTVLVTAAFQWNGTTNGTYTLTVPPMTDGTAGGGMISVTGGKDTSGNTQAMPYTTTAF